MKRELRSRSWLVATRCRIVSVSEVDEKIAPSFCSGALHGHGVGEVAVVGDRQPAIGELGEERLHVAQAGAAGGGVARVADGAAAGQALHHRRLGEGVADQADMAFDVELGAVDRRRCRPLPGRDAAARAGRARRSPRRPGGRRCRTRRIRRGNDRRPRRPTAALPAFALRHWPCGLSSSRSSTYGRTWRCSAPRQKSVVGAVLPASAGARRRPGGASAGASASPSPALPAGVVGSRSPSAAAARDQLLQDRILRIVRQQALRAWRRSIPATAATWLR